MSGYSRLCLKRRPGSGLFIDAPCGDRLELNFEQDHAVGFSAPKDYLILRGKLVLFGEIAHGLRRLHVGRERGHLRLKLPPGSTVIVQCPDRSRVTLEVAANDKVRIEALRTYRILRSELDQGRWRIDDGAA